MAHKFRIVNKSDKVHADDRIVSCCSRNKYFKLIRIRQTASKGTLNASRWIKEGSTKATHQGSFMRKFLQSALLATVTLALASQADSHNSYRLTKEKDQ
jgi:hypothetical protein